jgi:hypothetical protein
VQAICADSLLQCTGLLIVSKKGIYIAHYWENISFNMDPVYRDRYKTQKGAFQATVARGLRDGVVGDPRLGYRREQESLRSVAQLIDHESIHAFLMIPDTDPDGTPDPYREYWDRIKSIVGEILQRLNNPNDANRWTEYSYHPQQDEEITVVNGVEIEPLLTTSRGRMLFQFDPNHNGLHKTFVGLEDTAPIHGRMEWDPNTINYD